MNAEKTEGIVAEKPDNMINISVRSDRNFKKKVITNGDFETYPREGAKVQVKITDVTFLDSNGARDVDSKSRYFRRDFKGHLEIGDAEYYLDEALERCLQSMSRGEKSLLRIEYKDNEGKLARSVTCQAQLLNTSDEPTIGDWPWSRLYAHAERLKDRGVALVKANRVMEAFRRFSKGYKMILSIEPYDPEVIPTHRFPDLMMLKLKLINNLSHCQLHFKEYNSTINICNLAISMDDYNTKGIYRRGVARMGLGEWEAAYEDMQTILRLEPNNRDALAKLDLIKPKYKAIMDNYTNVIKKMFG